MKECLTFTPESNLKGQKVFGRATTVIGAKRLTKKFIQKYGASGKTKHVIEFRMTRLDESFYKVWLEGICKDTVKGWRKKK